MTIPDFDNEGNLPEGTWGCTWEEMVVRFGVNRRRRELLRRLHHLLGILARKRVPCRVYVNGSFVTAKLHPRDIDVVLEIPREVWEDHKLALTNLRVALKPEVELFFVSRGSGALRDLVSFFYQDRLRKPKGLLVLEGKP